VGFYLTNKEIYSKLFIELHILSPGGTMPQWLKNIWAIFQGILFAMSGGVEVLIDDRAPLKNGGYCRISFYRRGWSRVFRPQCRETFDKLCPKGVESLRRRLNDTGHTLVR